MGDPNAWRAALRVLEHALGRPSEVPDEASVIDDPLNIAQMSREQRNALLASVLEQHPHLAVLVSPHARQLME